MTAYLGIDRLRKEMGEGVFDNLVKSFLPPEASGLDIQTFVSRGQICMFAFREGENTPMFTGYDDVNGFMRKVSDIMGRDKFWNMFCNYFEIDLQGLTFPISQSAGQFIVAILDGTRRQYEYTET